jgi:3-methyl-2-oxobutanoate hydroxymethyltransferase
MKSSDLIGMKKNREKFSCLVLYDASFAKVANEASVDVIVVGDSVGMSISGYTTTVPVSIETIIYHTNAVKNGNTSALLIGDMPYMSYATKDIALANATKLMQAGAHMIKIEGGSKWILDIIEFLSERDIPVCGHIGLTPQSFYKLGGHKVQGKSSDEAQKLLESALAIQNSGAELLVLECIPKFLGQEVTTKLSIPTMGAGAGPYCDGQVLLLYDLIGISGKKLKFTKNFLENEVGGIYAAIKNFVTSVKDTTFPGEEHCF